MIYVSNCIKIVAESKVQELLRVWHEDCGKPEVNDDKVTPSFQTGKDESTNLNISAKELLKSELLAAGIHNPTEYAISIISKTVKCDDSLVRGISLDSKDSNGNEVTGENVHLLPITEQLEYVKRDAELTMMLACYSNSMVLHIMEFVSMYSGLDYIIIVILVYQKVCLHLRYDD